MNRNGSTHNITQAEKTINQFLYLLSTDMDEREIENQIQKLNLLQKIEEMSKWDYRVIPLVPLLIKIIIHKKMRSNFKLLKSIIELLGELKPDGFISEYAFKEIVQPTSFTKEEIFEELQKKKYIENYSLSPHFKPLDENFNFDIDARFQALKENIVKVLLLIPKDISVSNTLITLLRDESLTSLHPIIIKALSEIGHPVAIPILLELIEKNEESARIAIIKMGLRDIEELRQLLKQGVQVDVWGNNLKEKVVAGISSILPFFLDALTLDSYSEYEKKLICFLFSEIGIRRKLDLEIFVRILPVLYEEDVRGCSVTKILITGGAQTVPYINTILEEELDAKDTFKLPILQRFLYILGEIGLPAKLALPQINNLLKVKPQLSKAIEESIQKIRPIIDVPQLEENKTDTKELVQDSKVNVPQVPVSTEIPDTEDETSQLIDKVQKQTKMTDPEDYVLY